MGIWQDFQMSQKISAIGFDWSGVISVVPGRLFAELAAECLGVTLEEFNRAYFFLRRKTTGL